MYRKNICVILGVLFNNNNKKAYRYCDFNRNHKTNYF